MKCILIHIYLRVWKCFLRSRSDRWWGLCSVQYRVIVAIYIYTLLYTYKRSPRSQPQSQQTPFFLFQLHLGNHESRTQLIARNSQTFFALLLFQAYKRYLYIFYVRKLEGNKLFKLNLCKNCVQYNWMCKLFVNRKARTNFQILYCNTNFMEMYAYSTLREQSTIFFKNYNKIWIRY